MNWWKKLFGSKESHTQKSGSIAVSITSDESPKIMRTKTTDATIATKNIGILDTLWHAQDGLQVKSLVQSMSPSDTEKLVAILDLEGIPLNAFCADSFNIRGLDDRMVSVMHLAYRLFEIGNVSALVQVLDKIANKCHEKIRIGSSKRMKSFESKDPWLIGEDLMLKMHNLSIEILKKSENEVRLAYYPIPILEALLLDYPERLESRFWLAATLHNLYLDKKDSETKKRALEAINNFIAAAEGQPEYQGKVEHLKKTRSIKY